MPASTLRRRALTTYPPTESESSTPPDDSLPKSDNHMQVVQNLKPKTRKRRNTAIFLLGSVFGIIAAGFFAQSNDLIDFPELGELSMDSLFDVLPAGLVKDMRDLVQGEREFVDSYDAFSVGLQARAEGLHAHHPMIMVPGVISTGLESWGTTNVSRPYFRKRLWGSWSMMRALVLDKDNWKKHIMLDQDTGLDPPNIKLRAAQGFDATDFFITGYWIWNKIFENLASIGYDPTNSFTAAYDWRLAYPNLERRDQYFTRLKSYIETAHEFSGKKAVLVSHSMGGQVLFYFFHWVASENGGRGGNDWVERHVEAWINKFLSKDERAQLFRAMPGISSMLPIGGDAVWGNSTWAPDDKPGQKISFGSLLNFRSGMNWTTPDRNLTVDSAMDYLFNTTEDWYQKHIKNSYSHGVAHTMAEVEDNENDPRKWINPLETRLPLAPSMKIYCFYGVGKATERGYYYRSPEMPSMTNLNITIDTAYSQGDVDHGVVMGEGDGTVNLLSTGYMCNRGWQYKRYNPSGVKVTVVEMEHEPERFNPRGGPKTADHVDILGRQHLNELILRVAAGKGNTISDYVASSIQHYAERVKVFSDDNDAYSKEEI
ncbi:Phospholipid:diacylglycerol acyltransferase [Colletotrichum trifolii]|uniref:Phospholipid:diacylglycerol acyltransferase n=1 Tax=Colletotrichum trifolii TaxID=5466 RepID=A0A4R8Q4U5_COLTR|nr:Phospholipid:diacylglycerol acyltransferase [Colletotrichum trifolii]